MQRFKQHRMPTNPKPTLDVFHVPLFRVYYKKLEAYITQVFGFDFDFLQTAGVTEGQCVECAVNGVLVSQAWERKAADLRAGRRSKSVTLILNVLAQDGYIAKGKYIVSTHPEPDATKLYTRLLDTTQNPDSDECVAFRKKHAGDKVFCERAAILDKNVREYLKGVAGACIP